jgi:peptidoglycan/xylan/chitin deacetylase (PgdA/CDA1 family)
VSFEDLHEADVTIVYKGTISESKKNILIPWSTPSFMEEAKKLGTRARMKPGELMGVAAGTQTVLTITPPVVYSCEEPGRTWQKGPLSTEEELEGNSAVLKLDIVDEYKRIVNHALNAKPSVFYSLIMGLPIPYHVAPEQFRNFYMKMNRNPDNLSLCDKLPLDALRFILVGELERLTRQRIQRRFWDGSNCPVLLTHDIDTRSGLEKANKLSKIERKYDFPAAWYIPSRLCETDVETVRELASYGEVGAHDTKHDGKLDKISDGRLIRRVCEAKGILENATRARVTGFRAPLLQHDKRMIRALEKAGYEYDTSIPTWEPMHARTRKPHGIATTYPLNLEGIMEIPVTMPQDHQMLRVMKLAPKEVVAKWSNMMETIKEIGGLCTVLVHPDYELARSENLAIYEELVNMLASNEGTFASLPAQIADLAKSL